MTTTQKPLVPSPLQDLTTLPILQSDLNINDTTLFAVYCFIKNFVGHSPNAARIIDERIAVALDLVKRYLLYAVHEEVDALKHHITILLQRVRQLEHENMFLRANVPPHVLNILYGLPSRHPLHHSNHPGNGTAPPPPPPSN